MGKISIKQYFLLINELNIYQSENIIEFMKYILKITILVIISINLCAQSTSGAIDIEDPKQQPIKPGKESAESKGIEYLTKLNQISESGEIIAMADNDDSATYYLTALYLYCSIKYGVCPEILDSILTHDLINSSISKKSSCTNMKSFWKAWLANDMEKRHSYSVKIAFANDTAAFKKNKRNQYIRCQETITNEVATPLGRKDSIKKALKLATEINERGIDIFSDIGLAQ